MTDPLISIVIPVYNGERFVQDAMETVFGQTYRPIEVIVLNDGSTDRTAELFQPYLDRIIYLERPVKENVSIARKRGAQVARGEWIAQLDIDDLWTTDKLEKQITWLKTHPEAHYCSCLSIIQYPPSQGPPQPEVIELGSSAVIVHRSVFQRVGYYDPKLNMSDVIEFMFRVTTQCTGGVLNEVLVTRRVHGNNTTHRLKEQMGKEYLQLVNQHLKAKRGKD